MSKTFLFQANQFSQTIQFSISMPLVLFNPLIDPSQVLPRRARVDRGATAIKGLLRIPESPSIAETLPSDCLVSYPRHSFGRGSYISAGKQSVYSIAPADSATRDRSNYQGPQFQQTCLRWKHHSYGRTHR